jgi:hypothetical protein
MKISRIFASILMLGAISLAQAAVVTFEFNNLFSPCEDCTPPDSSAPWATATFDDGSGNLVLTLSVSSDFQEGAFIDEWYFNFESDSSGLVFQHDSGPSPDPIIPLADAYRAGGDGFFDILIEFPNGTPQHLVAGESASFLVGPTGLDPVQFDFLSAPGPGAGNPGPYKAAVHIQGTGEDNEGSAWAFAGTAPSVDVPEPGTLALLGLASLASGLVRRRRQA